MLKESDLRTYFNTNWNPLVIAEPEMRIGPVDETSRKFPAIYFRVMTATYNPASINSTAWIVSTPFEVELVGKTDEDITDLVNESARIICSRSGSGYWTNINDIRKKEYSDRRKALTFVGLEIKFALIASGV